MNQGLKNYTKQFSHEVSGVGTLLFNMCGGAKNMHMVLPLINTVGRNPISLSLIYNEIDKDEEGQFGKGFKLNFYSKLSAISGGYQVENADGSVDKYLEVDEYYNKETGLTLYPDTSYDYYELKDSKGNTISWDTLTYNYPESIVDANGKEYIFSRIDDTVVAVRNNCDDTLYISNADNTITFSYTHSNINVLTKTVLTLTNSKITNIKYYEGSSTLVKEVNIIYDTNCVRLKNVTKGNITKVDNTTSNIYKIYDGFMNGTVETYLSDPHFTIKYESLATYVNNHTYIQNIMGEKVFYCFDTTLKLIMEIGPDESVKRYYYENDTKNLKVLDNAFIKDEENAALNYVQLGSTSNTSEFKICYEKLWSRITRYNAPMVNSDAPSLLGESGDTITFSFLMKANTTDDAVNVTMEVGRSVYTMDFSNKTANSWELHTMSVKANEFYSDVIVDFEVFSDVIVDVGLFTLSNKKDMTQYDYNGKKLEKITVGTDTTEINHNDEDNTTTITVKEKNIFDVFFGNNNVVTSMTNKYGTTTELEYNALDCTKIEKETIICESEEYRVEKQKDYTSDGRFLSADYDEFGKKTQYEQDPIGRITKLTDSLNNILESTYTNGQLSLLKFNTNEAQNSYTYDSRKRLTKVEMTGGSNYEFVYNYKNEITQIKMNGVVVFQYEYDELGNIIKQQYGTSGDYYQFTYDSKNRLYEVYYKTIKKYIYVYDDENRLAYITNASGTVLKSYTYDELDRLVEVKDLQGTNSTIITNTFSTDDKLIRHSVGVNSNSINQSFDDFERSDGVSSTLVNNVKTIGFTGTNLESVDQTILNQFDIYPLHQDFKSLKGSTCYSQKLLTASGKPFAYNTSLKRYCYEPFNYSVSYKFGNSSTGCVVMRALKTSITSGETLVELKDTSGKTISLKFSDATHIALYLDGEEIRDMYNLFSLNTWHTVALSYSEGENASSTDTTHTKNFRLYVDGQATPCSIESDENYTSMTTYIGSSYNSTNKFTGQIEMLAFKNAYCEISTLNTLRTALNIISTKSSVDEFQRITSKEIHKSGSNILSNTYNYQTTQYQTTKYATYRVGTETIKGGSTTLATRTYTYDDLGRVKTITDPVFGNKTYEYNNRGFLINDNGTAITYVGNGNIKSYGTTTYTYDSIVKDKLIKVNNVTISYDSNNILNPSSYGNYNYSFEGKRLVELETAYQVYSYTYNEQGLRIRKDCDNGDLTKYFYDGDKLILEEYICAEEAEESYKINFLYDEQGLLFGLILNNANKYFYVRDAFQNILGLVDESGTLVVKYDYNAFGKILSVTDTSGVSIGEINPFRYKGYYYDSESRLYNINSLYYSPDLCRFIQPADVSSIDPYSINGLNIFSYGRNNPIIYSYSSLESSIMMFGKGHQGNMRSSKYAYWTTDELLARLKELSRKGHLTAEEKKEKKEIETELKARGERNRAKRKGYAHSHFSLSPITSTITSTPFIVGNDAIFESIPNINVDINVNEEALVAIGALGVVGGLITYVIVNDATGFGAADDLALIALIPLFILLGGEL